LFTTRCSHPLCNTQHTTTHPNHQTTTTPGTPPQAGTRCVRRPARAVTREQHPHPHNTGAAAVFSGPNSVPNSIHNGRCVPPSHPTDPERAGGWNQDKENPTPCAPGLNPRTLASSQVPTTR
jgi:hypothetical protein